MTRAFSPVLVFGPGAIPPRPEVILRFLSLTYVLNRCSVVADGSEILQPQIAGHLMKRTFDGSAKSLVMGALAAQPASREELAGIRKMIEAFAKEKGSSR